MNRYKRIVGHWFPLSPDDAGGGAPPPPSEVPPPAPSAVVAEPSKQEWADFHRTQRELAVSLKTIADGMKPKEAPKVEPKADGNTGNADVAAQLAEMRLDLDLERAMRAAKIPEGSKLSDLITAAAKATKPPNLREFVAGYADLIPAQAAAPKVVAPATPNASNAAAPVAQVAGATGLDGDPRKWPVEVIEKMGVTEYRAALDTHDQARSRGSVKDEFARINREREAMHKQSR